MQSLNLPGALEVVEKPEGLPPSIKEKSSEIKQEGGIDRLYDEISTVEELSEQVSSILEEVTEIFMDRVYLFAISDDFNYLLYLLHC